MYYWKLTVVPVKNGEYDVYFKDIVYYPLPFVIKMAIKYGDLIDVHEKLVQNVVEITEQEYFTYMNS